MLGIMGTGAAFAQAACAKKQKNMLSFVSGDEDLSIWQVSCNGEIVVKTIKGGEAKEVTYTDLSETTVALENDANTKVEIIGNVTEIKFYNTDDDPEDPVNISLLKTEKCKTLSALQCDYCSLLTTLDLSANTALTQLKCGSCSSLTTLVLPANTALTKLDCGSCSSLTTLDLSANTALTQLKCGSCSSLTTLDLSANTALTEIFCVSCSSLSTLVLPANTALTQVSCNYCLSLTIIKYPATDSTVSTHIANAITSAHAADGTVYTDSEGAYYSTIADAATAKGWTIEQL